MDLSVEYAHVDTAIFGSVLSSMQQNGASMALLRRGGTLGPVGHQRHGSISRGSAMVLRFPPISQCLALRDAHGGKSLKRLTHNLLTHEITVLEKSNSLIIKA